jgi:DDE family transposase
VAAREEAVKGPTPRRLRRYVEKCLRLKSYLHSPGDGRAQPRIPARALVWALLMGHFLRRSSFAGIEALVRSSARRALAVGRFGDDALGYFTQRLRAALTRRAAATAVRQAKRNKAFDHCRFIGLAVDGTGVARSREKVCHWCRPYRNQKQEIVGYHHRVVLVSVVGAGLTLPLDVEPYGPQDSEYNAGRRLLRRVVAHLGRRFAQYVVVDGEFARAPFLHEAGDRGLHVVARLKGNLPELFAAAQKRFFRQPPHRIFQQGQDRVEVWDADDFDPWDTLRWETVRVIRYRQYKPNGDVVEAYWLTDFRSSQVSSKTLYQLAKSRWAIENQGFNDAKSRHGFEHICHHQPNSLLLVWLLTALALTIERLYRIRFLHRGTHPVREAIAFWQLLWLSLSRPIADNSS